MSLDTLPPELLGNICTFCDPDEIKQTRQTCQCLRQVADKHLFPQFQSFMTKKSLATCTQIARHPIFTKSLREIWIQGDRPRTKTYELWLGEATKEYWKMAMFGSYNKHLIDELENCEPLITDSTQTHSEKLRKRREIVQRMAEEGERRVPPLSEALLRRHYEIHKSLTREAEQMLINGTYHDCLRAVFEHCVNLQDVYYTLGGTINGTPGKHFQQGLQDALGDPDSAHYRDGLRGMTQVVKAASEAGLKPKRLCLGGVCRTLFVPSLSEVSDQLRTFVENLEYLHWDFPIPWNDEGEIDQSELLSIAEDFRSGAFVVLMKHTTELRTLRLQLAAVSDELFARPALSDIVGDMTWPSLQAFDISSIKTSSNELVHFLLRHSETLEYVHLGNISLTTSSWPDCFGAIAGKLKALERVVFTGDFEDASGDLFCSFSIRSGDYAQQLTDYILHGKEEFPHPPAALSQGYQHESDMDSEETDGSTWDDLSSEESEAG